MTQTQPPPGSDGSRAPGEAGERGRRVGGEDGIEPWPSERALRRLLFLAALLVWGAIVVSLVGVAAAVVVAVVHLAARAAFLSHLRGSAVRLGSNQLPELHARVERIAGQFGLAEVPEVYLWRTDRSLARRAARFCGSNIVVLPADGLEACAGDDDARDFILGRSLAPLAAGHRRWRGLLLPGRLVPFLGRAYSRACVYTCDRYGASVCREPGSARRALCILATGLDRSSGVDPRALAQQTEELGSGLMELGQWLRGEPPLARRLAALAPGLVEGASRRPGGVLRGLAWLSSATVLSLVAALVIAMAVRQVREREGSAGEMAAAPTAKQHDATSASPEQSDPLADDIQVVPVPEAPLAEPPEPSLFARSMDAELQAVYDHPEFQRRAQGQDVEQARPLLDLLIARGVRRLDDELLHTRTRLMGTLLTQADAATCAAIMRGEAPSAAVGELVRELEPQDIAAWAAFSARAALLELDANPPPPLEAVAVPPLAPRSEIDRSFAVVLGSLPQERSDRLGQGLGQLGSLDDAEACWVARTLYDAIVRFDGPERAILERALVN